MQLKSLKKRLNFNQIIKRLDRIARRRSRVRLKTQDKDRMSIQMSRNTLVLWLTTPQPTRAKW
jgi:urease accessory protein UreE